MSIASIFAITAMLLILGLFFVVTVNVNLFSEMVKADYDEVQLFLKDGVSKEKTNDLMRDMKEFDGVSDVKYRSKTDAMKIMKKSWGENGYLLDNLGKNPLPASLVVTVDTAESAQQVTEKAKKIEEIEDVRYYKETVEKIMQVTKFLQWGALIIMAFLIIVSVVVVSNTIKLTVFARAKEISIMKYVGASNWFIRGPFLAEGILLGVLSSAISAGITFLIYRKLVATLGIKFVSIFSSPLVPAGYLSWNLVIIFLAIGTSVGACGSIISMRKFLDT